MDFIISPQLKRLVWLPKILLVFVTLGLTKSGAQTIGLNDLVAHTLANYPFIHQQEAAHNAGLAHEKTIRGNAFPSLIVQAQTDLGTVNAIQGAYFPMGVVPSLSGGNNNGSKSTLNQGNVAITAFEWEAYKFGYQRALQNYSIAQSQALNANLESCKYLVTQFVVELYLDWLKKYCLLKIKNEDVTRAEVLLTSIRAHVRSGLKPGADSSTARAVYSGAKIALLQAKDDFTRDQIQLASISGMQLDNALPDTNVISPIVLSHLNSLAVIGNTSVSHPLLAIYQKQYEVQLAENKALPKKYLPSLNLMGAYWLRNSGISQTGDFTNGAGFILPNNNYNYLVGLSATYNLFDAKHRHDVLVEGRLKSEEKMDALKTQDLALKTTLAQTNASYQSTLEQLVELPIMQQAAQQAFDQQLALYKSGLNTLVDVTNAQYTLLQAASNLVTTQTELLKLIYQRSALCGQQGDFLSTIKQ